MDRRTFIQGAVASAALALPMSQPLRRYKMGLQLYTMRAAMARDVAGTLSRISALGYQEVETYGFAPDSLGYYGLSAEGLLPAPQGQQTHDIERALRPESVRLGERRRHKALRRPLHCRRPGARPGVHHLASARRSRQDDREVQGHCATAQCHRDADQEGRPPARDHNHDFEFVEQNGQIGYDIILKDTDAALVKLQMDLYWIARGSKLSPHEWFKRAPGRFAMWHVKDMHKVSRDYTELGNGSIDFSSIWPDAELAGLKHYFVEQGGNFTHDPFQSITDSAAYMKRVTPK